MSEFQNPEERDRADRLFQKLAAEEPPIEVSDDTAPSSTAPNEAIHGSTRPNAVMNAGGGRFVITLAIGMVLMVTLAITVMLFINSDDSSPDVVADASQTPLPAPQIGEPTRVATEIGQMATEIPPTEEPSEDEVDDTEGPSLETFIVEIPPTAAADEIGAWLNQPLANTQNTGLTVRQDDAFTITESTSRLEVVTYQVQSGDTVSSVADRFGLDTCSIVWANPRNKVSPLRPGTILDILPVDGVLYRVQRETTIQAIADETNVSPFDIIDSLYNDLGSFVPETTLSEGMKIIVPDGELSDCNLWQPPLARADGTGGAGSGGGSLWGCGYSIEAGSYPTIIPVNGRYTFFQGFTLAHTGVDLAGSTGTPIVASGAGAVAFAGWNEFGYGRAIVIDHGGTYTLYAHLDSINVSCGQNVGAGEVIGALGSTGRSSGPHLHFEIRDGGFNPVNPVFSIGL